MPLTLKHVTFDSADARRLASWWAEFLRGEVHDSTDGWYVLVQAPGTSVEYLGFQRVDDPTGGKNRLHLDLTAGPDRVAEVERALSLGATTVADHEVGGFRWTVLADPDGNQFCISD